MKILERKIIGYKTETKVKWIAEPTEENALGGHMETYEEQIPITEVVTREATEEELTELNKPLPKEVEIEQILEELKAYDYIGTKIAMGVATREEYAEEIEHTERLRERLREING